MIDNKLPILSSKSQDVAVNNIKQMYYLDSQIHQVQSSFTLLLQLYFCV